MQQTTVRDCKDALELKGFWFFGKGENVHEGKIYKVSGTDFEGFFTEFIFCIFGCHQKDSVSENPSLSIICRKSKNATASITGRNDELTCLLTSGTHYDIFLKVSSLLSSLSHKDFRFSEVKIEDLKEQSSRIISEFDLQSSVIDSFIFFHK
jgi:hypothetical protein